MTDRLGWGAERVRVGPWRGDQRVALLAPVPERPPPGPATVRRCLDLLAERGYQEAVTAALAPGEQAGFVHAGFTVRERLHLLARGLDDLPPRSPAALRRVRRGDRPAVLAVDGAAFPPFWRLDDAGLEDALAATPASRFRVANGAGAGPAQAAEQGGTVGGTGVDGYAITGRAGRRGYLQRLAVLPAAQGQGLGTALVLDGLHWLRRRGAHRAVVNTQEANTAALALYERLGFSRQRSGLAVLTAALGRSPSSAERAPPGPTARRTPP